ncbi:MAG: transporter [Paracoccaceae bacterium]|nr:transporter [Paracoccaceae bacterium]
MKLVDRFAATTALGLFVLAATELAGVSPAAAQSMPQQGMENMDGMGGTGGMMRPDAAAPTGIVGGMNPRKGRLMPSITYMHMSMEGNRDGTDGVSTSQVLAQFPVAPLSMDVDMLMAGLMYGVTDDISVMAMVPYVWKSMDHVTGMGARFTTKSQGIGDARVIAGYDIYKGGGHSLEISAGLSLPTGSTDERDDTPAGPNQVLPYPMQIGSGTFDLLPGITYMGQGGDWSWGGQAGATLRLGENDDDYAFGNVYGASIWGARRWTDWVSSSVRLSGEVTEDIDGADPRLNPLVVPTADPDLRGGKVLSLGLGLNFLVPRGPAMGTRLSVEGVVPLVQNLDGPQVERDYMVLMSLRKAF